MTTTTPERPATIEFANGAVLEMPVYDPTIRTDLWVEAFDGLYRFWLPLPQAQELENKCGYVDDQGARRPRGILGIYGAVARGRYELEGRSVGFAVEGAATIAECRETIRLALVGGGTAVVDGVQVKVDPNRAKQLVDNYLAPAAVEASWDLAYVILHQGVQDHVYVILHTLVHGRKQRREEDGTTSLTAVRPLDGDVDLEGGQPFGEAERANAHVPGAEAV